MAQTVTLPTKQLERIERRLATIETAVKGLLGVVKTTGEWQLSEEAEQEYFNDLVEFVQQEKKHPTPSFTSADELMQHLDQV